MATRTLGTSSWAGPRTRRTLFVSPPRDSLHSSAYSVTSPLSSHGLDSRLMFHLLTTGSERARGSGTQLTTRFRGLYAGEGWQPTWDAPLLHPINLVRRFGCQPGTSECACPARSLVPDTLAPSLSDQSNHLPTQITSSIQNSLHLPCVTSPTTPFSNFCLYRAWHGRWTSGAGCGGGLLSQPGLHSCQSQRTSSHEY